VEEVSSDQCLLRSGGFAARCFGGLRRVLYSLCFVLCALCFVALGREILKRQGAKSAKFFWFGRKRFSTAKDANPTSLYEL
jgi:hypothetical protein